MTLVNIIIYRSPGWIHKRSLETGTNCPHYVKLDVDPADYPERIRELMWDRQCNAYRSRLPYAVSYEAGTMTERFVCDLDEYTTDAIANTIERAYALLAESVAERKEHEAERHRVNAERLAEEKARVAALAAARELLAGELSSWKARFDKEREDCTLLAEAIKSIPNYADLIPEDQHVALESASPIYLFGAD